MTTMRTRASKGSELTHGELDANFIRDVDVHTTTYTALVSDNRTTLECNHASTPFTITLGDAATMAAAETGEYEITVANIGAAAVTVAKAGSDTLDGVATSVVLQQYSSVTYKVNAATDGYNSIAGRRGITSTDAELNIMDGVTASTADLNATTNFEETLSATTSEVTLATGKTLDITDDGGLKLASTAITSTAAELNYNDISVLGTTEASKTVTTDGGGDVNFQDGKGLDFSAYTDGSVGGSTTGSILLDYEEGTWTPTIQDDTRSDSESQAYTTQVGQYTKIGNRVFFSCYVIISDLGTLTTSEAAVIAGLPYTSNSTTNHHQAISVGQGASLAITQGYSLSGYVTNNTTAVSLTIWDEVTGTTPLLLSEASDGATFMVSGHYNV